MPTNSLKFPFIEFFVCPGQGFSVCMFICTNGLSALLQPLSQRFTAAWDEHYEKHVYVSAEKKVGSFFSMRSRCKLQIIKVASAQASCSISFVASSLEVRLAIS